MAVYPFPSVNLTLSQVLLNYNTQLGTSYTSMNQLRGQNYWDSSFTLYTIPPIGNNFLLSSLFGKYSLDPTPITVLPSTTGNIITPSPVTGKPPPVAFAVELIGGGGGGGGAGGDWTDGVSFFAGGPGCGGGGGAYLLTNIISFIIGNLITVNSIPGGGNGGLGGFGGNSTSDGAAGNAGISASVTYASQTFIANGGSGGNGGFRGQITGGGAPANQPVGGGSFSGTDLSPSSASGNNGVVRGGGTSGNGQPSGGLGGQGGSGSNGSPGKVQVTWYFT